MSIESYINNNLPKLVVDNLKILPELNKEELEELSFIFLMNFENLAPILYKIYMELDDNSKEMLDKYSLEIKRKNLLLLPNSGLSEIQNGGSGGRTGSSRTGSSRTGSSRMGSSRPGSSRPGSSRPGSSRTGISHGFGSRQPHQDPHIQQSRPGRAVGFGIQQPGRPGGRRPSPGPLLPVTMDALPYYLLFVVVAYGLKSMQLAGYW